MVWDELRRPPNADSGRRRSGYGSEVAASVLLTFDGLEQCLEVADAEAERAVAFDHLEEHRRAIDQRLGEDLQ